MTDPRPPRLPPPGEPPSRPIRPVPVHFASPRVRPDSLGPSRSGSRATPSILPIRARLTDRDLAIIDLLDRHGTLTTDQITAAFFTSPTTASHRLAKLAALDVLDRFHRSSPKGGFSPWHWVTGPLGARIAAAGRDAIALTPRALQIRHDRLSDSERLPHLRGTNQFFIDLHVHARRHPQTRLVRWWSEYETAARYNGRIHPDGHALWRDHDTVIGLFLEYDRSTEALWRLVRKLAGYDQIARERGACYPVLFWLKSDEREADLHEEFARRRPSGPVPVATAVRGPGRPGPAGPVWALLGTHGQGPRRTLAELPFDHGDPYSLTPNLNDPDLDYEL